MIGKSLIFRQNSTYIRLLLGQQYELAKNHLKEQAYLNFKTMKKLELQNFGVVEMHAKEMRETDGGQAPGWLKKLGWGYLATQVIDNWEDIKKGFSDGYNAK